MAAFPEPAPLQNPYAYPHSLATRSLLSDDPTSPTSRTRSEAQAAWSPIAASSAPPSSWLPTASSQTTTSTSSVSSPTATTTETKPEPERERRQSLRPDLPARQSSTNNYASALASASAKTSPTSPAFATPEFLKMTATPAAEVPPMKEEQEEGGSSSGRGEEKARLEYFGRKTSFSERDRKRVALELLMRESAEAGKDMGYSSSTGAPTGGGG